MLGGWVGRSVTPAAGTAGSVGVAVNDTSCPGRHERPRGWQQLCHQPPQHCPVLSPPGGWEFFLFFFFYNKTKEEFRCDYSNHCISIALKIKCGIVTPSVQKTHHKSFNEKGFCSKTTPTATFFQIYEQLRMKIFYCAIIGRSHFFFFFKKEACLNPLKLKDYPSCGKPSGTSGSSLTLRTASMFLV